MKKYIFYPCSCEELVRYSCECLASSVSKCRNKPLDILLDECNVIAFADSNPQMWGKSYLGHNIISPEKINEYDFDKIIVISFTHFDDIYNALVNQYGVSESRIETEYVKNLYRTRERFLYSFADIINGKQLEGDVAEGGVFRGEFSKEINNAFPERKIYLFDTFEGFDERDCISDKVFSNGATRNYSGLKDTSVELVLSKMPHPENVVVKKGYFPESARGGVYGKFVFVNLDFDLYSPIKSGLEFFWDKMQKGGVILIHDYFNKNFDAKKAVDEFCEKNGACPLPIGDLFSVAIIKN